MNIKINYTAELNGDDIILYEYNVQAEYCNIRAKFGLVNFKSINQLIEHCASLSFNLFNFPVKDFKSMKDISLSMMSYNKTIKYTFIISHPERLN